MEIQSAWQAAAAGGRRQAGERMAAQNIAHMEIKPYT
jgi:hypothetical protein